MFEGLVARIRMKEVPSKNAPVYRLSSWVQDGKAYIPHTEQTKRGEVALDWWYLICSI